MRDSTISGSGGNGGATTRAKRNRRSAFGGSRGESGARPKAVKDRNFDEGDTALGRYGGSYSGHRKWWNAWRC